MTGWQWVRSLMWARASVEVQAVHATLEEVERRIREMKPAATSRTDFEGGKRRALRMVKDMKREARSR